MISCASLLHLLVPLLCSLISISCGDGQLIPLAADGGDQVEGAKPIDEYDSDSGSSTGQGEDGGPPTGVGLCDDYPEPQGGFAAGDVVANYALRDRSGQLSWLCEAGGGDSALLLLVLSSKW